MVFIHYRRFSGARHCDAAMTRLHLFVIDELGL
jgi:hypothetical protein